MENVEKDPDAPGEEQRIGPLGKKAIDEAEAAMGLPEGARADVRRERGATDGDAGGDGGE
jgi:hypothetical protein